MAQREDSKFPKIKKRVREKKQPNKIQTGHINKNENKQFRHKRLEIRVELNS